MLKKLLITVAASSSFAGIALSQTPQMAQSPATTGQPAAQQRLAMQETPDQLLASQLKGTEVIDSNNQKVGSVSDILFDRNGNIVAYSQRGRVPGPRRKGYRHQPVGLPYAAGGR